MKYRSRMAMWVGLGVLVAGLGISIFLLREPAYQGKFLSEWLKDFDKVQQDFSSPRAKRAREFDERFFRDHPMMSRHVTTPTGDVGMFWPLDYFELQIAPTASVVRAVREIGTDALPTLVKMAGAKDSWFKKRLMKFSKSQSMIKFTFTPIEVQRSQARRAFWVLGRSAVPAAPGLVKLLDDKETLLPALMTLETIVSAHDPPPEHRVVRSPADGFWTVVTDHEYEEERKWKEGKWKELFLNYYADLRSVTDYPRTVAKAMPPAILLLNHTNSFVRAEALRLLTHLARDWKSSTPLLMEWLKHPSPDVRAFAVATLCSDGVRPPEAVPALANCLKDPARSVRIGAVAGLRHYGIRAKAAVPALLSASRELSIRDVAIDTLRCIDPEAVAEAGVK